jgi:hypothetical protein
MGETGITRPAPSRGPGGKLLGNDNVGAIGVSGNTCGARPFDNHAGLAYVPINRRLVKRAERLRRRAAVLGS